MVDLYNVILDLCEKKGISGGKMCSDIGLSRSFMTELKKGRAKTITYSTAHKLAEYFNVSIDYFNPEAEKTPDAEASRAGEKFEKIWAMYSALSDSEKEAADRYLAFLLESQKND